MVRNRSGAAAIGVALACAVLTPQVACADEVVQKEAVVAPQVVKSPFGPAALNLESLAKQRGGTDPGPLSDMKLNGVVSDNRASNLVTGNNSIADGALAGVSGVPLVVQNSGNNVLIQSATIINVQVK